MSHLRGENKKIILRGTEVAYCLKTSGRAKNLRITIKPGGRVNAVRPRFLDERAVEKFLTQKADWILDKIFKLKNKKNLLAIGDRRDFLKNRQIARDLVFNKLSKFNDFYKFDYNRVAIRDQQTRWGSCSAKKNLNFNYRIALLPDRLADYVVAHELCHLRELNHSPRFWNLLSLSLPDYKFLRHELRVSY